MRVVGGSASGSYVVLVRGFQSTGSLVEWYHESDLDTRIAAYRFGARFVTPYYDGAAWWLYGRFPKGNEIRRWKLEQAGPTDDLDLADVKWLHENISDWAVTSTVTGVSTRPFCIRHTGAGHWPVYTDEGNEGEGNPWVFAKINGQWYGGTFEWLRPGQECKPTITRKNIGAHTKQNPLSTWVPKSGEVIGFAMSTPARSALRTSNERTNIALSTW